MSLSKPREQKSKNPAKKFIKWKGARLQGFFMYYDKDAKKDVQVDLSKGFIILDKDLFSITGFNDVEKSNIISNEVRTIHDKMVVKEWKDKKSRVLLDGPYSQLKSSVANSKLFKYTRSVYAYLIETGEMVHIQLTGKAFSEFLTSIENHPDTKVVAVKEICDGVQGSVEYKYPTWHYLREAEEEEMGAAIKEDKILQAYLEEYLEKGSSASSSPDGDPEFDASNWREFSLPNGQKLGTMSFHDIIAMRDMLIEAGDIDGKLFECVNMAKNEYCVAQDQWRDKSTRSGKKLGELSLSDLQSMLGALVSKDPFHTSRPFLEAGISEMILESDDDIPF